MIYHDTIVITCHTAIHQVIYSSDNNIANTLGSYLSLKTKAKVVERHFFVKEFNKCRENCQQQLLLGDK